jgi:hypothetical protein
MVLFDDLPEAVFDRLRERIKAGESTVKTTFHSEPDAEASQPFSDFDDGLLVLVLRGVGLA